MNRIFTRISTFIVLMMAALPAMSQLNCPFNIDFEMGDFTSWHTDTGHVKNNSGVNTMSLTPSPVISGRHTIVPYSGGTDYYGGFPTICPNGSGFSVKLGNDGVGSEAERIWFNINIPAGQNNYSIVYWYAVVLQDGGHQPYQQPRFDAKVYDLATGSYNSCTSFNFVANGSLPGFLTSTQSSAVHYKPWSSVTINLSGMAGHTVRLEFTTADCTESGHFGYAYVDVNTGCTNPLADASFCPKSDSTVLQGPTGYQSYQWWDTAYHAQLGTGVSHTLYNLPARDTALYVIAKPYSGYGCPDTILAVLHPLPLPTADAGADVMSCNGATGASVTLGGAPNSNLSYYWSPAAQLDDQNAANPHATVSATTSFYLNVIDNNNGCSAKDTVKVTLGTPPVATFTIADDDQCLYQNSFQYAASAGTGNTFAWNYGDGANGTGGSATHSYATVNTFPVKLVVTGANGCMDSTTQNVTTHPSPTGTISVADTNICAGSTHTLTAAGGSTYVWYQNGTAISGATGTTYGATQAGTYTATTTDQYGCVGALADTVVMTVTTAPSAAFTYEAFCEGIAATFVNTSTATGSGAVTYNWDFGDGYTTTAQQEDHIFTTGGDHNVKLTVTPTVCPNLANTVQHAVSVESPKPGQRYTVVNTAENTATQLTARPLGGTYAWSPGTHLTATNAQVTSFSGLSDFEYTVTITTPKGCVAVDTQLVRVFKETNIVVPQAFSPNGDGRNDRMFPFTVGIQELKFFRIINRWGTVVYQTSSLSTGGGWDGTYKGQPQPLDSYMWEATGVDVYGKAIVRKGTFTLLR